MLHIVHAYTFKVQGRKLRGEPIAENRERDLRFSALVKVALASGYPVYAHERISKDTSAYYEASVLRADPLLRILFHPKVTWIQTDDYGTPLPEEKPDERSEAEWAFLTDLVTTRSEFANLVGDPEEILVCGGEFPNCERNLLVYMHDHFTRLERRFYIPELSVTIPEDRHRIAETTAELNGLGFEPVSCEEAIKLVCSPLVKA